MIKLGKLVGTTKDSVKNTFSISYGYKVIQFYRYMIFISIYSRKIAASEAGDASIMSIYLILFINMAGIGLRMGSFTQLPSTYMDAHIESLHVYTRP